MEIRVFTDSSAWANHKIKFCSRVSNPDAFDFNASVRVFKSIYGSDCVLEFVVV